MADNPLVAAVTARRWNPYVVGVGIGLLSCMILLTSGKLLGTSSSFVHASGLIEGLFAPAHVVGEAASPYFAKEINEKTPMFDWQVMLVIGLFIGSFASSRLSGEPAGEKVPKLWAWRFGDSVALRYAAAFAFGAIMLFGARLAGGCTSGHGISGGLQLALSSWTFFVAMFASGVVTAFVMFGAKGRAHVHD